MRASCLTKFLPCLPAAVDPCKQENGGCEQKCINYGGQAVCQCYAGFRLAADRKTCKGDVDPTPHITRFTFSDVVAVLRGHMRTSSLLIVRDLRAYPVCALLLPRKTNYRLFHRKFGNMKFRFFFPCPLLNCVYCFEIYNYILHCTCKS